MKYKLLAEILPLLELYETEANNSDMNGFLFWLSQQRNEITKTDISEYQEAKTGIENQAPDVQISILIGRMAKYTQCYTRQLLKESELSGLDDYSFMATLMFKESMTKSELTHHNLIESTTGSDIIKRLQGKGFIEMTDDEVDKRAKRVFITSAGRKVMSNLFAKMGMASNIVGGNLTKDEKATFIQLLFKLELFHNQIYTQNRKLDIIEIHNKYFK